MMHFLVNARQTSHGWELPYPVEQLALWVATVGSGGNASGTEEWLGTVTSNSGRPEVQ
ncbi:MAG: hypothetical protein M9953_05390 [Thermomicrobiales bacterium]|nr:hypothetical protein [Thermomicrobiales bacterium]